MAATGSRPELTGRRPRPEPLHQLFRDQELRCGNVEVWSLGDLATVAALQPGRYARLAGRLVGAALQDGPALLLAVAAVADVDRAAVAWGLLALQPGAEECWIPTRDGDLATVLADSGWLPSLADLQLRLELPAPPRGLPPEFDLVALTGPNAAALLRGVHELADEAWGVESTLVEFLDRFWRGPADDPGLWVVARQSDVVCGAAIGHVQQLPDAVVGKVASLMVAPHARGRGLAAAVLAELCDRFRSRGLRLAQLGVHADNRSGAPVMYRRLGWTQVSSRTRWRPDPEAPPRSARARLSGV